MTLTDLKNRKFESGFTIVELLIVIVVIAILAALVLTAYNGVQQRARDAARQSDVRSIATAAEAYASENAGTYPADKAALVGFTTVKIDQTVQDKIGTTDATASTNTVYKYLRCTATGAAKITWWKEEAGALQVRNLGSATGTTATC